MCCVDSKVSKRGKNSGINSTGILFLYVEIFAI